MSQYWLFGVLACLASVSASAQTQPFWAERAAWYLANQEEVAATLRQESSFAVVPVVSAVCEIWNRRDGAIGTEIAPGVALALIYHPRLTLGWFRDHPEAFEAWLDQMPHVLFTDYDGEQHEQLEALRLELVDALSAFAAHAASTELALLAEEVARIANDASVQAIE